MGPKLANFYKEMYARGLNLPLGAHFFVKVVSVVMIKFIVSVSLIK